MILVRQYVRTPAGLLLRSVPIFIHAGMSNSLQALFAGDGTPISNPILSSESGIVQFYVADGTSALSFSPDQGFTSIPQIPLPVGVNDVSSSQQSLSTAGIAASNVTIGQAVETDMTGKFTPCVNSGGCIGIATQSAIMGQPVNVLISGVFQNSGYSFIPEQDLYIGVNGYLTQTPPVQPSMPFSQKVGVAISSTKILINIEPSIDLI